MNFHHIAVTSAQSLIDGDVHCSISWTKIFKISLVVFKGLGVIARYKQPENGPRAQLIRRILMKLCLYATPSVM